VPSGRPGQVDFPTGEVTCLTGKGSLKDQTKTCPEKAFF